MLMGMRWEGIEKDPAIHDISWHSFEQQTKFGGFLGAAPGQEKAEAPTGDSRERPRSGDLPTNIDPAE